jgi:hypothetical protein
MLFTLNAGLLVSTALYEAMKPYLTAHTKYNCEITYKGEVESSSHCIVNIEERIDCLDMDRSQYSVWVTDDFKTRATFGGPLTRWYTRWRYKERMRLEHLFLVYHLVIRADFVPDNIHAFYARGSIKRLVSDELREAVIQSGCTGVEFTPVPTSHTAKQSTA